MEIRRDGAGPAVPVDIHTGRDHGIRGDNSAGPHAVRQSAADQCPVVGDTDAHANGETKLQ